MFCQVTWPIATGAATVGSSPVGSMLIPITTDVFGSATAGAAPARHRMASIVTRHAMAGDLGSGAARRPTQARRWASPASLEQIAIPWNQLVPPGCAPERLEASPPAGAVGVPSRPAANRCIAQVRDGVLIQNTEARDDPELRKLWGWSDRNAKASPVLRRCGRPSISSSIWPFSR